MTAGSRRPTPDFAFERAHALDGRVCVGVDEVGRGCLAGPVVTAAVVLPSWMIDEPAKHDRDKDQWWLEIKDSKLLSPADRERLSVLIWKHAEVQVAWCTVEEIDRWNILHASMIAMRRAVRPFVGRAQAVLVDGNLNPYEQRFKAVKDEAQNLGFTRIETLVKGDQRSVSIAAASVVAKVYRDRWMVELDRICPGYEFKVHKGYSTPLHKRLLVQNGASPLHRTSFAPVRSLVCKDPFDGQQSLLSPN